jgi:hypothetical protein
VNTAITALNNTPCNFSVAPAPQSMPKEGGVGTAGPVWTALARLSVRDTPSSSIRPAFRQSPLMTAAPRPPLG